MLMPKMWWAVILLCPWMAFADDGIAAQSGDAVSPWAIHGDGTLIDQHHGSFSSSVPDGPNSFESHAENSYSTVLGVNLGYNLGEHSEAWVRVESIRGIPLSEAGGLAALTNNDMQRIMENHFTTYLALGFISSSWDFGGERQDIEADAHQFARQATSRHLNLLLGKMDLLGIFDDNAYAHKSDDQFLNWCFMTSCAYDFAADARGYTWGAAAQMDWDAWSVRGGWFAMPRLPNQLELDGSIGQHFGINGELERHWTSGSIKLLAYQGRMKLADYSQWLNVSGAFVQQLPKTDAKRGGAGLNLQQELAPHVGLFARAFWTGGHYETMAFTEADSSASAGVVFEGGLWHRPLDGVGLGFARNEINHARQSFLAAGNYDLFIGDGSLLYAPEMASEIYYRFGLLKGTHITLDWQNIQNPAYNQQRGPVNVYGIRLHGEF
jgi:high affinity Mn2+ porin